MKPRTVTESLETQVEERHEVIVAGGGASGLIATLAAAHLGRKVALIEGEGCLGARRPAAMWPSIWDSITGKREPSGASPMN